MKIYEYKRILEEHAETAASDDVKAAYRLSLAMFLMVEMETRVPANIENNLEQEASGKAEPAAEGKAAGGETADGKKEEKELRKAGYRKAYNFKPKKCKNCGETFTPHYGSQTMCVECAATIARIAEMEPKKNLKISDPEYRKKMAEDLAGGKG